MPEALKAVHAKIVEILPAVNGRPFNWFHSLAMAQKHVAILDLPASSRSQLGFQIESLCRGLTLVEDFKGTKKNPACAESKWLTKSLIRAGAAAIADLALLESQAPGLPGVADVFKSFLQVAQSSATQIILDARAKKASLLPVFKNMQKLCSMVDQMAEDTNEFPMEVISIVAKYEAEGSAEVADLQNSVAGHAIVGSGVTM